MTWESEMANRKTLSTRTLGSAIKRRPVLSTVGFSMLLGAVLIWYQAQPTPEERAVIGQWFDAKANREPMIVEFKPDYTVTRTAGSTETTLGHWRMGDGRVEVYQKWSLASWPATLKNRPLFAGKQLWSWVKYKFSPRSNAFGGKEFAYMYYTIVPTCDGSKLLDEVVVFGCFDTPRDEDRYASTIEEAVQRDRMFAERSKQTLAGNTPSPFCCPG